MVFVGVLDNTRKRSIQLRVINWSKHCASAISILCIHTANSVTMCDISTIVHLTSYFHAYTGWFEDYGNLGIWEYGIYWFTMRSNALNKLYHRCANLIYLCRIFIYLLILCSVTWSINTSGSYPLICRLLTQIIIILQRTCACVWIH